MWKGDLKVRKWQKETDPRRLEMEVVLEHFFGELLGTIGISHKVELWGKWMNRKNQNVVCNEWMFSCLWHLGRGCSRIYIVLQISLCDGWAFLPSTTPGSKLA